MANIIVLADRQVAINLDAIFLADFYPITDEIRVNLYETKRVQNNALEIQTAANGERFTLRGAEADFVWAEIQKAGRVVSLKEEGDS